MIYLTASVCGLCFVAGAFLGVYVGKLALRSLVAEANKRTLDHCERVENRLAEYVTQSKRVADALEKLVEAK